MGDLRITYGPCQCYGCRFEPTPTELRNGVCRMCWLDGCLNGAEGHQPPEEVTSVNDPEAEQVAADQDAQAEASQDNDADQAQDDDAHQANPF